MLLCAMLIWTKMNCVLLTLPQMTLYLDPFFSVLAL